jgi:hypothetical protein
MVVDSIESLKNDTAIESTTMGELLKNAETEGMSALE